MGRTKAFYVGKAAIDQLGGSGWFVGQFVPAELGLRHQDAVEIKWGIHPDGEHRPRGAEADGLATTISVLIRGILEVTFEVGGKDRQVTLDEPGDYVIFGPETVHRWHAIGETIVLSVRFPSIERRRSG